MDDCGGAGEGCSMRCADGVSKVISIVVAMFIITSLYLPVVSAASSSDGTSSTPPPTGWIQTAPAAGTLTANTTSEAGISGIDSGNFKVGTISGMEFNDPNRNGKKDPGEVGLANWTIRLSGYDTLTRTAVINRLAVTDANGNYSFTNVTPGRYVVCENSQPNWKPTTSACVWVSLAAGNSTTANFGNVFSPSAQPWVTPGKLISIAVTPQNPTIALGQSQQFNATGTYSNGSIKDITTTATWSSSNNSVATIDAFGLATAVAAGTTNITASSEGMTSPAQILTVTSPKLISIAVTPVNPTIVLGESQQFTAYGTYSDGSTKNITTAANWTSSNSSVAAIDASGLATSIGAGTTLITAASEGITSPAQNLTVTSILCNGNQQYYRDITINNTGIALTDYQVLINLTGSAFPTGAQTSGADIRFWAGGAELSYWIEKWDFANRSALVWVNVSSILASGDTRMRMHYGNLGAVSASDVDATFLRVIDNVQPVMGSWHLDEGAGTTVYDNSGKWNNGALVNGPSWMPGKFSNGLNFDGLNDFINAGNDPSLSVQNAVTIEAWVNASRGASLENIRAIADKSGTGNFTDPDSWSFYDTAAQNSSSKGLGGAIFDGRYVYFAPVYNGQVTRYDTYGSFTNQSSWSFYNTALQNSNSKDFRSAVFDGRYVYFVPYGNDISRGQVTRYDTLGQFTDQNSWDFYDMAMQNPNSKGFQGAVFDGRYVYFVPTPNVLYNGLVTRYDTTKSFIDQNSWTFYDTMVQNPNSKSFDGAVFDGRYLYFVPYGNYISSGQVTRYDTTDSFTNQSSWSFYDTVAQNPNSKGFAGAVFDGRYVYFVPDFRGAYSQVTRYDTTGSFTNPSSWSFYDTAVLNSNSKGFAGAVFDGRYVYFVPHYTGAAYNGQVTRYDTTGSFTNQGSWSFYDTVAQNPNSKGFFGAVFDGRYLYFVPDLLSGAYSTGLNGQVTRYDTIGSNASYSLLYGLGQNSYGSTPFGFGMRINTNKGIYSVFDNRIQTKGWHHVTGTYNGTKLVLYIDGIPVSTANASGSINVTKVPLTIGSVLNSYFNGSIDEVRIYNRALNTDEVRDIYNNYGYTTLNYPGRVLVRKYTSPEPLVSIGAEKGFCDSTPPASITNLTNVSYAPTYINWTWTDPADSDFANVSVWIDGIFKYNVSRGMQFFNATGFAPDTEHIISTRTVDTSGNINQTWVNHTARTAPELASCNQDGWQYYRDITINNTGSALTDYQVLVNLTGSDFPANAQASGADLRFRDAGGAELSYWIERWDHANRSARVWVKVSSLPASADTTIRMHYGNPSSGSSSNGDATFIFFDDFDNFNTSKWAGTDNYSVSPGQLTIRTGSVYSKTTIGSQPGLISEAKVKWNNFAGYSGLEIADSLSTRQHNYGSNKLVYLMTNAGGSANITAWAANGTSADYDIIYGTSYGKPDIIQFVATAETTYIIGHAVSPSQVFFYKDREVLNSYN